MKRTVFLMLASFMFFTLASNGEKAEASDTADMVNDTVVPYNEQMTGEMPDDEYERAEWYGFVSKELSKDRRRAVTWKEYCTMIGTMISLKDTELGTQWQEIAKLALSSDEEMVRDQGCFALYRAAELMGEEQNDGGIRSVSTNPHLLPSNDGTLPFSWNFVPFTGEDDTWVYEDEYEGLFGSMNYFTAAVMYCQYRMSLCSYETLYDTRTDIIGPLTVEEAAISVLRLYESTPDHAEPFWRAKIDKINEEVSLVGEPEEVTAMRQQIRNTETSIVKSDTQIPGETYTGTAYYVSNHGNDENDGLTPETAWATLDKVNHFNFSYGDAVFFERGGIYRGVLYLYDPDGYITLSAYGEGEKPVLTSAEECAADAEKWILWQKEGDVKIWKYYKDCLDCGFIVFDDTTAGNKVLADWSGSEWINEDGTPFDVAASLTENLDFFSDDSGRLKGIMDYSVSNNLPVEDDYYGPLYLRCDQGNPGELYDCIELCTMVATEMEEKCYRGTVVDGFLGTVIDNLCVKYFPMDGICVGPEDCIVQNCEVAWGGGCVQYIEAGKVTGQMGDAINGCGRENSAVRGNYIHDVASSPLIMESYSCDQIQNISFSNNLVERTTNGININDNEMSSFENVSFNDNVFYLVGVSDGMKHDVRSGNIRCEWTACFRIRDSYEYTNCTIQGNSLYYPLQFFYYCEKSLPEMSDNLYVPSQETMGFADIRYDEEVGPYLPTLMNGAEGIIRDVFEDSTSILQ